MIMKETLKDKQRESFILECMKEAWYELRAKNPDMDWESKEFADKVNFRTIDIMCEKANWTDDQKDKLIDKLFDIYNEKKGK